MLSIISSLLMQHIPQDDPLCVIDGGAQGGGEGVKWGFLGRKSRVDGFDPDADECQRLNAQALRAGQSHYYHPVCLARTEANKRLYVTRHADSSSLYKPAEKRLARWKQCADGQHIFCTIDHLGLSKTVDVKTTSVDLWVKSNRIACVDFIKVDVQGSELDILRGAVDTLGQVLGIETEVEFVPLYEDQPLFADVDSFVRQQGFTFFNFLYSHSGHFAGRMASPVSTAFVQNPLLRPQAAGQLITADALYLINPLDPSWPVSKKLTLAKYLKLIVIAEVCGQIEYAFELLAALRDQAAPIDKPINKEIITAVIRDAARQYLAQPAPMGMSA